MAFQVLVDGVRAVLTRKEKSRLTTYRQLVQAVAGDKAPDAEGVAETLELAGRSLDDLQRDTNRILERRRLETVVAGEATLQAERQKLDSRLGEFKAAFEAARLAWVGASEQLKPELDRLDGELFKVAAAKDTLRTMQHEDGDDDIRQEVIKLQEAAYANEQTAKELRRQERDTRAGARRSTGPQLPQNPFLGLGKVDDAKTEVFDKDMVEAADKLGQQAGVIETEVGRLRAEAARIEQSALAS